MKRTWKRVPWMAAVAGLIGAASQAQEQPQPCDPGGVTPTPPDTNHSNVWFVFFTVSGWP